MCGGGGGAACTRTLGAHKGCGAGGTKQVKHTYTEMKVEG